MQLGTLLKLDFGETTLEKIAATLESEQASARLRMQQGVSPEEFAPLEGYSLALARAKEVLLALAGAQPASGTGPSATYPLSGLSTSPRPAEAPAEPPKEVLSHMAKAGFLALAHGLIGPAREIFDGLAAMRPRSPIPLIGQALILVESAKGAQGVTLLREKAIGLEPECDDLVRAHLGLVLRLIGSNQEACHELRQVVADGRDANAVSFARGLLQEYSPEPIPAFASHALASAPGRNEESSGEWRTNPSNLKPEGE